MAELCDFDVNGADESLWSEEHDLVPLKQRLKLLLAKKKLEDFDATEKTRNDANVKREDEDLESQVTHSAFDTWEGMSDGVSSEESNHGELEECNRTEIGTNDDEDLTTMEFTEVDADIVPLGKVSGTVGSSLQHTGLSQYPVKLELENTDYISLSSVETCLTKASNGSVQECAISTESHEAILDDLDHVVLKERQRMLLSRKELGFIKPAMEGNMSGLSNSAASFIQRSAGIGNEENIFDGKDSVTGASHLHDIADENASGLIKSSPVDTSHGPALTHNCQENTSSASGISASMHENCRLFSYSGNNFLSGNQVTDLRSALPIFANVKAEPMDSSEFQIPSKEALDYSYTAALPVKSEVGIADESLDDKLDHMLLQERMILRASKGIPSPAINGTHVFSRKVGSSFDYSPAGSSKPIRMKRPRKRRKTATDSVETAMEEDAPGLLQVLIEKGVLLDEIKLYDEMESDEVLDDSLTENSFAELEAVIIKLFSQRQSLLKFAPIRCGKGERASYCLACLISLVEQARYLQFRKWPVEWGWCRDLQSFIFVFERHNRIVLERPEYGYATYFFELVDSLPIHWQLKRLVIAMKLTSCSRVSLLENRALTVGDDLTEGEARVLMDYGWVPDSGLGTMLNYCDRVVHDRKNEKDSSEWRTKIGKLLVDGYNGGTIVSTDIPKHVIEHDAVHSQEIKLEL